MSIPFHADEQQEGEAVPRLGLPADVEGAGDRRARRGRPWRSLRRWAPSSIASWSWSRGRTGQGVSGARGRRTAKRLPCPFAWWTAARRRAPEGRRGCRRHHATPPRPRATL